MSNTVFDERQVLVAYFHMDDGAQYLAVIPNPPVTGACRIDQILGFNSDVVDHDVTITYNPAAGPASALGGLTIPAGSGYGILGAVDILTGLNVDKAVGLQILPGDQILIGSSDSVTTTGQVTAYAVGGTL